MLHQSENPNASDRNNADKKKKKNSSCQVCLKRYIYKVGIIYVYKGATTYSTRVNVGILAHDLPVFFPMYTNIARSILYATDLFPGWF